MLSCFILIHVNKTKKPEEVSYGFLNYTNLGLFYKPARALIAPIRAEPP